MIDNHLNKNSLRNKFELLPDQNNGTIDISNISETKIDENFHISNRFSSSLQSGNNENGGGIMLYVKKGIPANPLAIKICHYKTSMLN